MKGQRACIKIKYIHALSQIPKMNDGIQRQDILWYFFLKKEKSNLAKIIAMKKLHVKLFTRNC
jgi:hypothetical protein